MLYEENSAKMVGIFNSLNVFKPKRYLLKNQCIDLGKMAAGFSKKTERTLF